MKKRSLAKFGNAFEQLEEEKQEEQEQPLQEIEKEKEIDRQPVGETVNDLEFENDDYLDDLMRKRKTIEDTHTRQTFLVRNDLKKELDRLFKRYGYGFKIKFITKAIENELERIKEKEQQQKKK